MHVDVFPDLTAPTVTVLTEAHGLEAVEVEKVVTYPLETAFNGAPNVRRIRSSSAAGISIVWVEFDWGTDIYLARQIVNERIGLAAATLPEGTGTPMLAPVSSIMGEIMLVGITSDSLTPMELRTLTDWEITPRLKSVPGVANVIAIGGEFKQYQALADPQKLRHYGLTLEELTESVAASGSNVTGGVISQYGNQYSVTGNGRSQTTDEIGAGLIKETNGAQRNLRIRDVAEVTVGPSDKIGDGALNASPAVILTISKQPEVNTLNLTERLDQALSGIQAGMPANVSINSHIFRQSDFILTSIDNLKSTLLEGAFFVALILFIFLMNWRTTVISLLAIPVSLLVTVLVLHALHYTINTMSLGGMAIAIGALVDDAIIDVENVLRRLRENALLPPAERRRTLDVVREASVEIRGSIVMATLIIIVSFVPLFFLGGMEGRLLQPLGIAFIVSVLTSLLVAVTLTPALCSYLLGSDRVFSRGTKPTPIEAWTGSVAARVIRRAVHAPRVTVGAAVLIFLGSLLMIRNLGQSFLPEFNEGSLVISIVGVPGISLEESNKTGTLAETLLLEMPEVEVVTRRTGRAESDEHAQGVNASEIDVPFTLGERSKEEFIADVRSRLSILPGVNVTVGQPIAHRIDHMLSGTRANIAIKVFGPDLNKLFLIGKEIEDVIGGIEGIADVAVDPQVEVPQVRITPRREILAAYGLTVGDLMEQVDIAFGGEKVGNIYEGQRFFDLIVRYEKKYRQDAEALRSALISLPGGGHVPLDRLAQVASLSSPYSVSREDVQRKVVVAANVQERDLVSVVNDIQTLVSARVKLPSGYHLSYGGQFENQSKASRLLFLTSAAAVLVILLLLYVEFRNLRLALVVLLNLPLALIGGVLAVSFTSGIVSIASIIGFISLFGIATRNGILLVSKYEEMQRKAPVTVDMLITGVSERLNPILMTAFTTGLALIPLVLKGGEPGNEIQSPMAVVILGGLLSATLLNLLVIPSVYLLAAKKAD